MIVLVDIGNTSLKWCRLQGQALGPMGVARHSGALPIDVLASWEQLERVEKVLVASVGPEPVVAAVRSAAAAYWQCPLIRIESQAQAQGVRIAYADADRLGVDRFLALVGAHWLGGGQQVAAHSGAASGRAADDSRPDHRRPQPAAESAPEPAPEPAPEFAVPKLIVDAGTAITFDALLADGTHLGGQILPGVTLLRQTLLRDLQLPPHQTQDHAEAWGADTGSAIAAASLQAPAALAERLLQQLQRYTGIKPRLILTGSDAERLTPLLPEPHEHQPALVLQGLARFAAKNPV